MNSATGNIDLFTPYSRGALQRKNRLVMAPLTRSRAGEGNVPSSMAAVYYSQRANAVIGEGLTDLVAFGQLFIANPDLPERFRTGGAAEQAQPANLL
jgi:N-ethylmaleimide reductase